MKVGLGVFIITPLKSQKEAVESVDGSPNLASANISSIDVDILYQHCCAITDDYSAYIALSEQLIEEYRQGTHTKELSRKQIEDIAHILPPYSQWCDPVFDEKKANYSGIPSAFK